MFQIVSWTKTQNLILSDLVDTSTGISYEVERDKLNHINAGLKSDLIKAQCKSKRN